jgi:hypothetical protein
LVCWPFVIFSVPQPKHQASDRYSSTTVTESQVQNHMEELYEEDEHGYQKTKKAKEHESAQEERNHSTEATIPANTFFNELNRYPALILNADYQVRTVRAVKIHELRAFVA